MQADNREKSNLRAQQFPQGAHKSQLKMSEAEFREAASSTLEELIGTKISNDVPLMSAGLDSIAATEFT